MPNVVCPDCHAEVVVADPLNPPKSCPQCGLPLPAGAAGLPTAATAEPLTHNKWRTALIGLKMMFWSLLVLLVTTAIVQAMQIVAPVVPDPQNPFQPAALAALGFNCFGSIFAILFFVGLFLCCFAPDSATRQWAILSVGSALVSMVAFFVVVVVVVIRLMPEVQRRRGQPIPPEEMLDLALDMGAGVVGPALAAIALMLLSCFAWYFIHVAIANAFQNASLRRFAYVNIAIWPFLFLVNVAATFGPAAMFGIDETTKLRLQAAIGLAVALVWYGIYLPLAHRTIKLVEARTGG